MVNHDPGFHSTEGQALHFQHAATRVGTDAGCLPVRREVDD